MCRNEGVEMVLTHGDVQQNVCDCRVVLIYTLGMFRAEPSLVSFASVSTQQSCKLLTVLQLGTHPGSLQITFSIQSSPRSRISLVRTLFCEASTDIVQSVLSFC